MKKRILTLIASVMALALTSCAQAEEKTDVLHASIQH